MLLYTADGIFFVTFWQLHLGVCVPSRYICICMVHMYDGMLLAYIFDRSVTFISQIKVDIKYSNYMCFTFCVFVMVCTGYDLGNLS